MSLYPVLMPISAVGCNGPAKMPHNSSSPRPRYFTAFLPSPLCPLRALFQVIHSLDTRSRLRFLPYGRSRGSASSFMKLSPCARLPPARRSGLSRSRRRARRPGSLTMDGRTGIASAEHPPRSPSTSCYVRRRASLVHLKATDGRLCCHSPVAPRLRVPFLSVRRRAEKAAPAQNALREV